MLQLTQQVVGNLVDALIGVLVTQTLDTGNKTRPGSFLQLIQHGSLTGLYRHVASPKRFSVNLFNVDPA